MGSFLLLGQLNHLKIELGLKNGVFSESRHFDLSTGTKKYPKMLKIEVAMSKNIFNFFPKIHEKLGFFVFATQKLPLFLTLEQKFLVLQKAEILLSLPVKKSFL